MMVFLLSTSLGNTFLLPLYVLALDETCDLQQQTMQIDLMDPSANDEWNCVWGSEYSANRFYTFYFKDVQAHCTYKWIWKLGSTMKIKVFGWLLLSDRLNTRNMLKRRHYNIGTDFGCLLCTACQDETMEHLFFECTFSLACWNELQIMGHAADNRLDWVDKAKASWSQPLFMEIFLLASWSIWKERNNKHFRGVLPSQDSWRARLKEDLSLLTYRLGDKHKDFLFSFISSL